MNIKHIDQYTLNDLNNESVKAKLADIFKVSDTLDWTGSYGVDLHDPASCFAVIMTKPENVDSVRVYHCRFEPEQSSLEEANSVYELCADIASQMASLCYSIALSSPIAFAIHPYDRVTIEVVFSNLDAMDGSINEDSFNYLLYSMRDIA